MNNQQNPEKSKIKNYLRYLLHQSNNDEHFQFINDIQAKSKLKQPNLKNNYQKNQIEYGQSSRIKSLKLNKKNTSDLSVKIYNNKLKHKQAQTIALPPIVSLNKKQKYFSVDLQKQKNENWKKYYNQHKLQTIVLDDNIMKLIQKNQFQKRKKKRYSIQKNQISS